MGLSEKTALRLWAGVAAIEDHPAEVVKFAQAVEAQVRKDDESLIRQMLEALESSRVLKADYGSLESYGVANRKHDSAITAARARLEKAP